MVIGNGMGNMPLTMKNMQTYTSSTSFMMEMLLLMLNSEDDSWDEESLMGMCFVLSTDSCEKEGRFPVYCHKPNVLWGETWAMKEILEWCFTVHISLPQQIATFLSVPNKTVRWAINFRGSCTISRNWSTWNLESWVDNCNSATG